MSIFRNNAERDFHVKSASSEIMEITQTTWNSIIQNNPPWKSDDIRPINFAKFLCYYTSKKTCMDLRVTISGSDRADYINRCIKEMVDKSARDKVEDAVGLGGIIFKPTGTYNPSGAIDYVLPDSFIVTEKDSNGDILGIIFVDRLVKGDEYYTRLEYQHFIGEFDEVTQTRNYAFENKAYKSRSASDIGKQIPLTDVPEWEHIQPIIVASNIEKPLFGYFKMPFNNTIDYGSPEGVSIFANCIEELRDLDISWSRKSNEIDDSQHMTFIDENALMKTDKQTGAKQKVNLPRFVKGIKKGVDASSTIDEHVATLLTEQRIADINSILSMISTKAGFSQGQFVLDRKTGQITATQIESDDSETIETISDIRKNLKTAINDLIYALNKYCDIFFSMPDGYVDALDENVPEENIYYFKDLLASFEQDRNRAYQLMLQGIYSKKKYLMEYEGFSEEEAIEMLKEAKVENQTSEKALFGEE